MMITSPGRVPLVWPQCPCWSRRGPARVGRPGSRSRSGPRPGSGQKGQQGGAGAKQPEAPEAPEAEKGLRKICEGAAILNNAATKNKLQVKLKIIDH